VPVSRQATAVAAALIEHDGHYLLARRGEGRARSGLWELPGGKVEAGETDSDALIQELREELGIDVSVGRLTDTTVWSYVDVTIELRTYRCTITAGDPTAHEHAEIRWVAAGDLLGLPLCEADRRVARRLADGDSG
jgi:8-oxo-dGTP diphosphatase